VAGQVQAGSVVDIVATFSGSGQSKVASARVIVSDVSVLIAAQPSTGPSGVVTLALTPQQVQEVAYAESFAQKVWLSLVAPGTTGAQPQLPPYQPGL
jgi:Flp pilus assembly protein CpaB